MQDKPLLSIVIANYNYGRFLEEAIQSVITQEGFDQCELIVVDGGSTDNSVEIVKKYADKIAWWVSERDKGQSDAFNKGFSHAHGHYLTWLNADDLFVKGALAKVLKTMRAHLDCQWFTANCFRFTEDGQICEVHWGPNWIPRILQTRSSPIGVFGPTSFFSKELFTRMGGFDVDLQYTMDTDLWVKFITAGVKFCRVKCFCWAFRMHVGSKTAEFSGRRLPDGTRAKIDAEVSRIMRRSGYRMSRINRILQLSFRCVDGSLWQRFAGQRLKGHRYSEVSC